MIAPASITAEVLGDQIVREASRFVGLREVRRNSDWDNPKTPERDYALAEELRRLMRPSPWEEGWAYCAGLCRGRGGCGPALARVLRSRRSSAGTR